jgi:hypothetical protein
VQVVDGEQQRPVRGEVEREPEEPVQHRERRVLVAAAVAAEHGGRRRRGALQRTARGHLALEELAHDAVGELALELADAGGEHAQPGAGRAHAQVGEQPGLADPRRPLDEDEPALPGRRGGDHLVERRQLGVALEERHDATPSAVASSRRERMPSFRYVLERWTSTVFGVT